MDNLQSQTQEERQNIEIQVEAERRPQAQATPQVEEEPEPKKRKKSGRTSPYWKFFTDVIVEEGDPPIKIPKAKCIQCGTLIKADSALNGTTCLKNHHRSCVRKHKGKGGQTTLVFQPTTDGTMTGSLLTWKFDQQACRMSLCEMIILDELPFRFVEREGFRKFVERLCPQFKIPSRHTIRADCVKIFLEQQVLLKAFFQRKGMGRVSITTDCWTAINNTNYICVTAHCIDTNWVMHKKIITFRKICSHKGADLGAAVISSLEEWGLKKIFCCTMDNASANDGCIKHMKPILDSWNTSVVGGKFLHMRCVAHVLNLVVNDGLEEIGLSVRRVREAVKWITGSPSREEAFNHTVHALKINCSKFLSLDVPTRWNGTYTMLESAQVYEEAFLCFASMNKEFRDDMNQKKYKDQPIGVLEKTDWINIRRMVDYLEKFFDMTLLVSGTTYVTSHQFFKEMCDVFEIITDLEFDDDKEIRDMATKMKMKLGKYWLEPKELNPKMNKILYIAALLDPRQKMKHVEMCLTTVYGEKRASELVAEVNSSLYELFAFYKKQMAPPPAPRVNTTMLSRTVRLDRRGPRGKGSCSSLQVVHDQSPNATDMSELTVYFTEKQHMMTANEVNDFDILQWWSTHGPRFPILSMMARDVLAIPISSVASECAFSNGGRVLSPFRSSLTPKMVEALLCAEDWLRSSSSEIFLKDEEDVPETELEKEFEEVWRSLNPQAQSDAHATTSQNVV